MYLLEAIISTDGTSVSLWWKCLSTPFIYTLFYIIYTNYTFGYFTHTVYTHSIPCVLFIICVLCVFYDSIHVLNVMFFSEPYLVLFIIMVSKQVYKELWWSRIFQLKAYTRLCCMCAALQPSLWWVKNFLHQQSIRQFRYLRYGCPHPFSFINPCVNGVSLLLLFGLVSIYDTVCFVSSVRVTRGALGCWWWRPSSSLASMSIFLWGFRLGPFVCVPCSLLPQGSQPWGGVVQGASVWIPCACSPNENFSWLLSQPPFRLGGGGGERERREIKKSTLFTCTAVTLCLLR